MSGDVQPRKRKDKRRKRDAFERKSEGELSFSRQSSFQDDDESSHGVHITKMGSEDVHLHVHEEHGTGGHWCAKIIFFSLMAVLLGLVGLIILENRGLADLDTPLSESRFSNYFDGWVEEHRETHDEHDAVQASIEKHDEHDEPFEEEDDEENQSEVDDDADAEADDDEHEDDEEEAGSEADKGDDDNDDDDDTATAEQTAEADDDDDNINDDDEDNETAEQNVEDNDDEQNDDNDDEENDNNGGEVNDDEEEDNDATAEVNVNDNDDNDNDNEIDNDDNEEEESVEPTRQTSSHASARNNNNDNDDDDDIFDEDDSFDNIVDNDAEELLLLQQKAAQQATNAGQAESNENNTEDDEAEAEPASWGASLAVKIGIGVALALVARLVLIRKNPNTKINPKAPSGAQTAQQFDDDDDEDANDAAAFELFEQELRRANERMMEENYAVALQEYAQLTRTHSHRPEAFLAQARVLDRIAEAEHSNKMLIDAIEAYKRYLAFGQTVTNDSEYRAAAERCIERMRFMGYHLQAVPIHEQLIERFADESKYRNQLSLTYLMMNRLDDVKVVAESTLRRWPTDGLAQLHYGFALKQIDKTYEKAVQFMQLGIASNAPGTQEGFFYFTLGELLQRMGRTPEALQIYERGAALQLFPSVYQRALYNEPNLRAQPFWLSHETGYEQQLAKLEQNWQAIRDEALALLSRQGYFEDEAENLRDTGSWQQYELYARGQRRQQNCQKAPITCGLVAQFEAASGCKRGQVKFSVMHGGTHVWPHCGPTNCRLRAHLGLVVPNGTRIRVAAHERSWSVGKFLIFDDSFEHEVWHNGTSLRLVLIVDIWHPDLTHRQRQALTQI